MPLGVRPTDAFSVDAFSVGTFTAGDSTAGASTDSLSATRGEPGKSGPASRSAFLVTRLLSR